MEILKSLHPYPNKLKTIMKNHSILFLFAILIFMFGINAINLKTITVIGKVTAKDGSVLSGVNVAIKGSSTGTNTDAQGKYSILADENGKLVFSFIGYKNKEVAIKKQTVINVILNEDVQALQEVITTEHIKQPSSVTRGDVKKIKNTSGARYIAPKIKDDGEKGIIHNTEEYDAIHESRYLDVTKNALSTFSIDVDKASYGNIRRYINSGQLPSKDVVRIEEMLNYFTYDYKEPKGEDSFAVNTEISTCPWNSGHKIIQIGLQGKNIPTENLPASNLVFLIDVSGSMEDPNKLPLLKSAYRLLVNQLREKDNVAIVVYAGAAGVVLPSTPGNKKDIILAALDNLHAGGSTAGGAGIELAYNIAKENFKQGGNNRVILATDGDFNVGTSSNADMESLITKKRETGIFLTVLGFGMGNYKDSKMEILADKGNGNYAYIDNILEAEKVFVREFGGTLYTIAKDVRIQVEFNPTKVKAYRLIGYENRALKNEDFNDDKKDTGK